MSVQISKIHNLPPQPTTFIGRASEIAAISTLLESDNCSLLTLVGAGGIGKTRLSIEVASQRIGDFVDGAFFIPLAPLSVAENIVTTIANIIGLHLSDKGTLLEQLLEYLHNREMLLIMDNFEHLLDGVDIVADILYGTTDVKCLVTSREALNLQEEWVRQIAGMRFPEQENIESIEPYSALKLFMERAHRVRGDFDNVSCAIRICQLVGGMPLAIELATAWLRLMPCEKIIQEIQRNLDFLVTKTRNTDERHRSMRAVFDHSWQLLSKAEQNILRKLSVFHDGFELEAAEQVTEASLFILAELVEKSLLRITATGRYEFHELLRQYAEQHLEATGEIEAIHDAHRAYYLNFLHQREKDIKGRRQFEGLEEIDADFENVRTAWMRAVQHKNYDDLNAVIECLDWFSSYRARWQEGRELFRYAREGLAPTKGENPHPVWGRIVIRDDDYGGFVPFKESWKQIEWCLALAKQYGDRREVAYCLNTLGIAMFEKGDDYNAALRYWTESLAIYTELNDTNYIAWLHLRIGLCHGAMKQGAKFGEFVQRGYKLMNEKGDHLGVILLIVGTMDLGLRPESNPDSISYETEFGDIATKISGWHGTTILNIDRARWNFFNGYFEKASQLLDEVLAMYLPTISHRVLKSILQTKISIVTGLIAGTQAHYKKAKQAFDEIGIVNYPGYSVTGDSNVNLGLAIATFGLGDYPTARRHLHDGLTFLFDSKQLSALITYMPVAAIFMAHENKQTFAVELLGLAYHHPASITGWLDKWELLNQVRSDLETQLSPDAFAAAWERGKKSELDETVTRLLEWLTEAPTVSTSEFSATQRANKRLVEPLSDRELEVLLLIAEGESNPGIAARLFVGLSTVKKHINHIYRKLDVKTRTQAIARARDLNLI